MSDPRPPVSVLLAGDDLGANRALARALEAEGDLSVVGETVIARGSRDVRLHRPGLVAVHVPSSPSGAERCLMLVQEVMADLPTPILVMTPVGGDGAWEAMHAAGALDSMPYPGGWDDVAGKRVRQLARRLSSVAVVRRSPAPSRPRRGACPIPVVGIAASTGGPQAVGRVLADLAGLGASVLVVQHIHEDFVDGLLDLMRRASGLPVELAEDSARLREGVVYLARANRHLALDYGGRAVLAREPLSIHRPSADVLFHSLATHAGPQGIGVVLTGMGADGADGLLALHRRRGTTIAQDEASCAVFGMPRAAHLLGAIDHLVPLDQVAGAVRRAVEAVRR